MDQYWIYFQVGITVNKSDSSTFQETEKDYHLVKGLESRNISSENDSHLTGKTKYELYNLYKPSHSIGIFMTNKFLCICNVCCICFNIEMYVQSHRIMILVFYNCWDYRQNIRMNDYLKL